MKKYIYLFLFLFLTSFFSLYAQNYSLSFDGNDYITIPHDNSLNLGSQFTVECWFTVQGSHSNDWIGIVSKTEASHATVSGFKLGLLEPAGYTYPSQINFSAYYGGSGTLRDIIYAPPINTWHHLAASYDGSMLRIFFNGVIIDSVSETFSIANNTLPLTIGGQNGNFWNRNLNGKIDEVRISSVARYTADFTPTGPFSSDASTLALYHFDEGTGTTVYDQSGNNNDGTIYGAVWSTDAPAFGPSISLISPSGGEYWQIGTDQIITWSGIGFTNVMLEYSTDSGTSWNTITASTPAASGSYTWTIPNTPSNNCLVKISDVSDATLSDVSNSFTISQTSQNYSLYFDSNYGGIEIPFDASLNSYSATNQISVSMWVKPTDTVSLAYNMFVRKAIGSFNDDFCWGIHDTTDHSFFFNNQRASSGDQVWNTGPTGMIPHQWNHIELNFDANIGKAWIYVNGSKIGEQTGFLTPSTTAANVFFIFNMSAFVDEIYYSNAILHASTVTSFTPPESMTVNSNTIGYWKLNEGTGTTVNDLSSNANNGIVTNGVWTTDVPSFSPSISITSPAGGEIWLIGSNQDITWSHFDVTNVKIEYSTDSGSSWNTITASTPAAGGSYTWTIPNTPSTTCLVKISDASDATVTATSNSFSIIEDPGNFSLYFDGIDDYGRTTNITSVNNTFTMEFWVKPTIVDTVPVEGAGGIGLRHVIHPTHGTNGWGAGHAGIGVTVGTNVIGVTEHAHNHLLSTLVYEGTFTDWTHVAVVFENRVPKLYVNGIYVKTGTTTGYTYLHPGLGYDPTSTYVNTSGIGRGMAEAKYQGYIDEIRISDNIRYTSNFVPQNEFANDANTITLLHFNEGTGSIINDESSLNNDGTISGAIWSTDVPVILPTVELLSPNGGENYFRSTVQDITWGSTFVSDVKLEYSVDNGATWNTIIGSVNAFDSTYSWTIPDDSSSACLVKITDITDTTIYDISDAVFTIYRPVVTLTAPNGGEYWKAGTTENITWTSSDVTNVQLEYSTNNGTNWTEIINSTPSDGSYSWTVPDVASDQYLVRITDVSVPTVKDTSDSLFQIYVPSVTVTAPNGGEEYRVGTTENINWTSLGVANVKLEYSTDNGGSWQLIHQPVDAAAGTYSWSVPDLSTTNALVRITDLLDAAITDSSNGVFTIHKPSAMIPFTSHWNILSVPWVLDDPDPNNVFPTKTSNVFAFSTGYYTINSLQPAQGFWIRFPSAGSTTVSGQGHSDSTVSVTSGWNIIGATEYDVAISGIVSTPPGIVTSDYFTFNTGYSAVSVIETGKGYWVKCSDAGTLLLPRNTSLPKEEPSLKIEEDWITITVEDASGDYRQLYIGNADGTCVLPPVPPAEILDARFDNDTYISDVKTAQLMKIQSGEYPIKITVSGGDLRVSDGSTGKIINRLITDGESLTITNANISILRIETAEIPTEYTLFQNYPNPFNPSTKIKFGLPEAGKVKLEIYNQLGQKVETLVEQEFEAGYHEIIWNAGNYASGIYFYTITSGSFKSVKKMMFLK